MDDKTLPTEKRCRKCDETKPRSEFALAKMSRDGLQAYCKPCMRTYGARNRLAAGHKPHPLKFAPVAERFWAKVNKGDPNQCWEWSAHRQKFGYGLFRWRGSMRLAHRVAWELTHGELDDAACVLHHCDNPPCCNPAHHFLGSRADNAADRDAKQRTQRGERHVSAKLTEDDVRSIRRMGSGGASHSDLAKRFGVDQRSIRKVLAGRSWKHVE